MEVPLSSSVEVALLVEDLVDSLVAEVLPVEEEAQEVFKQNKKSKDGLFSLAQINKCIWKTTKSSNTI
mgnify:CR=1 FL=1